MTAKEHFQSNHNKRAHFVPARTCINCSAQIVRVQQMPLRHAVDVTTTRERTHARTHPFTVVENDSENRETQFYRLLNALNEMAWQCPI